MLVEMDSIDVDDEQEFAAGLLQQRINGFCRTLCSIFGRDIVRIANSDTSFLSRRPLFTVSIEGNIGCGKSSLLNYFKQFPAVQTINEQLSKWTKIGGNHNALQMLYEDPVRWSFLFNQYAALTRAQMHVLPSTMPVKMLERSLHSTRYIFVENSFRSGYLSEMEYQVLKEWFDFTMSTLNVRVNLIEMPAILVYLRTSPEICLERVRLRDRKEESGITLGFLRELHELHEDLFVKKTELLDNAHVLILDATPDLNKMYGIYDDLYKSEILESIAKCHKVQTSDNFITEQKEKRSPSMKRELVL